MVQRWAKSRTLSHMEMRRLLDFCVRLGGNPLLITMALHVVESTGESFKSPAHALRIYIEFVMDRELSKAPHLTFHKQTVVGVLEELAALMGQDQRDLVTSYEVETVALHVCQKFRRDDSAEIVEDVKRSPFLVMESPGRYRFVHKSFLEYFVAMHALHTGTVDDLADTF